MTTSNCSIFSPYFTLILEVCDRPNFYCALATANLPWSMFIIQLAQLCVKLKAWRYDKLIIASLPSDSRAPRLRRLQLSRLYLGIISAAFIPMFVQQSSVDNGATENSGEPGQTCRQHKIMIFKQFDENRWET